MLCKEHYRKRLKVCEFDGCLNKVFRDRYCTVHRTSQITGRECLVEGCDKPPKMYGMCSVHGPRAMRQAFWVEVVRLKGGKCQNCGGVFPVSVYDLHHRDPETKEFSLGRMNLKLPMSERMLAEVDKCDLLCANCHRAMQYGDTDLSGYILENNV